MIYFVGLAIVGVHYPGINRWWLTQEEQENPSVVFQLEGESINHDTAALQSIKRTGTAVKTQVNQDQETDIGFECQFDFEISIQSHPDRPQTKGLCKVPGSLSSKLQVSNFTIDFGDLIVIIVSTTLWVLTLYIVKAVTDSLRHKVAQQQLQQTKRALSTQAKGTQTKATKKKSRASQSGLPPTVKTSHTQTEGPLPNPITEGLKLKTVTEGSQNNAGTSTWLCFEGRA